MATTNLIGNYNLKTPLGGVTPNYFINGVAITTTNAPANVVVINNLADLNANVPESGGSRTFVTNTNYVFGGNVTSTFPFILSQGVTLTSNNNQFPLLTYSGTGTMFTGTDIVYSMRFFRVTCPNAQVFDITDSGFQVVAKHQEFVVESCTKLGAFDNCLTVVFDNVFVNDLDDGLTVSGSQNINFLMTRVGLLSASSTFIALDLTTSVISNLVLSINNFTGGVGSIGLKGAANSANILSGQIARIESNNFASVTNALDTITVSDIRYIFGNNGTAVANSTTAAETFLSSAQVVTNTGAGVFSPIAGANWTDNIAERFTANSAGLVTYIAEVDVIVSITMTATIEKVGGGTNKLCARIAINGTTIPRTESCTTNADPTSVTSVGLFTLSQNDTIQGFVANEDSGVGTDTNVDLANLIIINGF